MILVSSKIKLNRGRILGITGKSKCGKDTIADYLINNKGWSRKLAVSDNLKTLCMIIFSLTKEQVYTQKGKEKQFINKVVLTEDKLISVITIIESTHPNLIDSYNKLKRYIGVSFSNAREILQFVGTELCRALVVSYHLDLLQEDLISNQDTIITDIRFLNEANLINKLGGHVINVIRKDANKNINKKHLSEISMGNFNNFYYTINNQGSLVSLYNKVNKLNLKLKNK